MAEQDHHSQIYPLTISPLEVIDASGLRLKKGMKAEATIKDLQSQVKQLLEPLKTVEDTKPVSSEAEARKIFGTKGDPDLTQVIEKLETELDQQNILEAKLTAQKAFLLLNEVGFNALTA
ncbi:hypothetical protein PPACK8108_LOCUS16542 [Phakopsora pachyrhizi]|uniref:Uncharacterized protein n=1 Tax=Phakopsora pachyrhizi TaxID=170000 RepID=A0AAV0B9I1_PHAPC|nr:hypothetical protein PPACK8108_LOCUS16542 [Phakopsora pachyrhizi]